MGTEFRRARSPEQQEVRRASILAAAREMLDARAPAEVSLRELSVRVGLAKSNVLRYFPTRETVFMAVLQEDWTTWLADLEAALPPRDRRRTLGARTAEVATAVAGTLAGHPRFCRLLVACPTVLEHNVSTETAHAFKSAARDNLARLAELVRDRLPELTEAAAVEFAGITWVLVAGAWPMANPAPVVAAVLAAPEFTALRVDFPVALARALTAVLTGLLVPAPDGRRPAR